MKYTAIFSARRDNDTTETWISPHLHRLKHRLFFALLIKEVLAAVQDARDSGVPVGVEEWTMNDRIEMKLDGRIVGFEWDRNGNRVKRIEQGFPWRSDYRNNINPPDDLRDQQVLAEEQVKIAVELLLRKS